MRFCVLQEELEREEERIAEARLLLEAERQKVRTPTYKSDLMEQR